jgi:hypothetical protein
VRQFALHAANLLVAVLQNQQLFYGFKHVLNSNKGAGYPPGPLKSTFGIRSVSDCSFAAAALLKRHAIHWQRHRETPAASEADCLPGGH